MSDYVKVHLNLDFQTIRNLFVLFLLLLLLLSLDKYYYPLYITTFSTIYYDTTLYK